MSNDLGLPTAWSGRMYQSFNKLVDWRNSVGSNLSKYGEGEGVRVLIIGSGIDDHWDLTKASGYNLSTGNPYSTNDTNGHSTFVAGIVAGNGKHFIRGIAPKAEVSPIKVLGSNELADFRALETALLWGKDNFASVILVDTQVYNTIPFVVKKVIDGLEKEGIPVFINGKKNGKHDFNKFVSEFPNNSCWLDNWYKKAENIDSSMPIAVGLAALLKEKDATMSVTDIYNKMAAILFPKPPEKKDKKGKNGKNTKKKGKDSAETKETPEESVAQTQEPTAEAAKTQESEKEPQVDAGAEATTEEQKGDA